MWLLATPWALLTLAAIPIALGIYFFRTRSRRREVSSLFLWVDHTRSQQGGRRVERLQFPLMLLLELLALILLGIAAAGPSLRGTFSGRPTVIILDTSYSMTATDENGKTPQDRAVEDLHRFFDTTRAYPIQFLLAGQRPELLPDRARSAAEAKDLLKTWTCQAPTDSLDSAISLAATVAPPDAKLLVVTDRSPELNIQPGKLEWRAYGRPLGNLAIVHASRTYQAEKDRILLEIANKSKLPQPLHLTLLDAEKGTILSEIRRNLEPFEQYRLRAGVPGVIGALDVRIDSDPLAIDNRLTLLPPSRRFVRVRIGSLERGLREKVLRAVEAAGIARIVDDAPEIVFTDGSAEAATETNGVPVWTVRFYDGGQGEEKAYVGPFLLDRDTPVTMGLSLEGIVWTATDDVRLPGTPIISAGEVPLMTTQTLRNGGREFRLAYRDRMSTLSTQAAWPALIWNLLKFRSDLSGGILSPNLRLGAGAVFVASSRDDMIELVEPDGTRRDYPVRGGQVVLETRRCGIHKVNAPSGTYEYSVGTLSGEESDLTATASGISGGWLDEETLRLDYRSIVWALLLVVLVLLALHLALLRKREN